MSIHDGVVTIDEDDVQVILGVEEDKIRLSAGGLEIGEWSVKDCSIDPAGDGVFTITAENETLTFVPNNQTTFTAAMNGGSITDAVPEPPVEGSTETAIASSTDSDQIPDPDRSRWSFSMPWPRSQVSFGLWALISIVL